MRNFDPKKMRGGGFFKKIFLSRNFFQNSCVKNKMLIIRTNKKTYIQYQKEIR